MTSKKLYIVAVYDYSRSAKNKGIINGGFGRGSTVYCVMATSAKQVHELVQAAHHPEDKRPLAGKSYVREAKVDNQVWVPGGYKTGIDTTTGQPIKQFEGRISEILDGAISIEFKGYHTKYVDFALSEIGTVLRSEQ